MKTEKARQRGGKASGYGGPWITCRALQTLVGIGRLLRSMKSILCLLFSLPMNLIPFLVLVIPPDLYPTARHGGNHPMRSKRNIPRPKTSGNMPMVDEVLSAYS